MNRSMSVLILIGFIVLGLSATPLQANFYQCTGGACDGAENADIIHGSPTDDTINGNEGHDIVFAGNGNDDVFGGLGNDVVFGDSGNDFLDGDDGNDVLMAGPDSPPEFIQRVDGNAGNDTINVLVGETSGCLEINDGGGSDMVNLIGFGPQSGLLPFGQPDFLDGDGYLIVTDPIAGGTIAIFVSEINDIGIEKINGLLSATPAIVDALPIECISN